MVTLRSLSAVFNGILYAPVIGSGWGAGWYMAFSAALSFGFLVAILSLDWGGPSVPDDTSIEAVLRSQPFAGSRFAWLRSARAKPRKT